MSLRFPRSLYIPCVLVVVAACAAEPPPQRVGARHDALTWESETLLARFSPEVEIEPQWDEEEPAAPYLDPEAVFDAELAAELEAIGVVSIRPLMITLKQPPAELRNVFELAFSKPLAREDLEKRMSLLLELWQVDHVEENQLYTAEYMPPDPRFDEQHAFHDPTLGYDIDAPAGWDFARGHSGVYVAVLDTGVDPTHPELAGRLLPGYDFIDFDHDPSDLHGHGTHVAGIIGAKQDGVGVAGLDAHAGILPVRVLGTSGRGPRSAILDGLAYALDSNALVLNLSLSTGFRSPLMEALVDHAWDSWRVVVAAAGNYDSDAPRYPAQFDSTVSVAALAWGEKAGFSSFGHGVDLSAPGYDVLSTVPTGWCTVCDPSGYRHASGTSMATPMVSGVLSVLLTPGYASNARDALARLAPGSLDVSAENPLHPSWLGVGQVNLAGAFTAPIRPLPRVSDVELRDPAGVLSDGLQPGYLDLSPRLKSMSADMIGVSAILSTADPYVTVDVDYASYGDLPFWTHGWPTGPYKIHVDPSIPYGHEAQMTLTVHHASGTEVLSFVLIRPWPRLPGFPSPLMTPGFHGDEPGTAPIVGDFDGDGRTETLITGTINGTHLVDDTGAPIGGWPVPHRSAADPVAASVAGVHQFYWVDSDARLHGYDLAGSALPGFPIDLGAMLPGGWARSEGQVVADDLDGDGQVELFAMAHGAGYEHYGFSFEADGSVRAGWPVRLQTRGMYWEGARARSQPAAVDLNGDGVKELFFGRDGSFNAYAISADLSFSWGAPDPTSSAPPVIDPVVVDIDGDGAPERVCAADSTDVVVTSDSMGWSADLPWLVPGTYVLALSVGEVTTASAGKEVVVLGSASGTHRVVVLSAAGGVLFTRDVDGFAGEPMLAIGDLDGDGAEEILTAGGRPDYLLVAMHGDGTLVPGFPPLRIDAWGVALADVDADGDLEIVAGTDEGLDVLSPGWGSGAVSWPMTRGSVGATGAP